MIVRFLIRPASFAAAAWAAGHYSGWNVWSMFGAVVATGLLWVVLGAWAKYLTKGFADGSSMLWRPPSTPPVPDTAMSSGGVQVPNDTTEGVVKFAARRPNDPGQEKCNVFVDMENGIVYRGDRILGGPGWAEEINMNERPNSNLPIIISPANGREGMSFAILREDTLTDLVSALDMHQSTAKAAMPPTTPTAPSPTGKRVIDLG